MRWLKKLTDRMQQWIAGRQEAGYRRKRRMLLERLQARQLLAGIPANDAWLQVSGTLLDNDSSGAYIQLTPSSGS